VGLVHGDYQPGNVLFEDGRAVAVIDWELSGIGAQGLDLGWLMMSADPAMWAEPERPRFVPSPQEVQRLYETRSGRAVEAADWYQALAGFRLASIACLNVKLHRKGQRHDPIWERFAASVMPMFERALQLLSQNR
jgi:aminoglycoside phosphotransferase (APT) family kinase protein